MESNQQQLPLESAPMSLTLDELDSHLFKCADIIRNAVDKTDYKDFILPLVFYKTISDTYQDRFEEVIDEVGDEEIARQEAWYDFVVLEVEDWALVFQQDHTFNSPTGAARVVLGRSSNGWRDWANGDGDTLDEIERQ